MDARAKEVSKIGDRLFGKKKIVDTLWQELAYQFYPERADFTDERNAGDEYSDHLFTSYPSLARRDLGNLMSANMRPSSKQWGSLHVFDKNLDDGDAERKFLEYLTDIQWRAMYDSRAGFVRATKQTDHDYVTFGNGVVLGTPNSMRDTLLYRNYHLRDCAWLENEEGRVDCMFRNWMPEARQLKALFPETISRDISKACEKEPEKQFKCRHIVMPSRMYYYKSKRGKEYPYVSLYIECESQTVLEEVGMNYFPYVVPRWMTVSGSQYGRSMATDIALPDSRTMQVIVRTLREAGEKFVDPPMIAVIDAIRGDIPLYAGGITNVDIEYDEKLGEVLRPVTQDRGGMPIGFELANEVRQSIHQAFFLDKINLPAAQTEMTAFEVRRRVEEHIRAAAPLFEPIEQDYNAPLCELTFNILRENNGFPMDKMPDTLLGQDIRFTFHSPLADAYDQADAAIYTDVAQRILVPAAQIDPAQIENADITAATRDAMKAAGWKAKWFKPIEAVEERRQQVQQQMEAQQQMAAAEQMGGAVEKGGKGVEAIQKAMGEQ